MTHKDKAFDFILECQESFDALYKALMSASVLSHFYHDRETQVETDASDGVIAGVLSQKNPQQQWHPIAFYSKTMAPAKYNYEIHNKEILAVI